MFEKLKKLFKKQPDKPEKPAPTPKGNPHASPVPQKPKTYPNNQNGKNNYQNFRSQNDRNRPRKKPM